MASPPPNSPLNPDYQPALAALVPMLEAAAAQQWDVLQARASAARKALNDVLALQKDPEAGSPAFQDRLYVLATFSFVFDSVKRQALDAQKAHGQALERLQEAGQACRTYVLNQSA